MGETMTLERIKCAECGYEAAKYSRVSDGRTYRLPSPFPVEELREASRLMQCPKCGAEHVLFDLGAQP